MTTKHPSAMAIHFSRGAVAEAVRMTCLGIVGIVTTSNPPAMTFVVPLAKRMAILLAGRHLAAVAICVAMAAFATALATALAIAAFCRDRLLPGKRAVSRIEGHWDAAEQ